MKSFAEYLHESRSAALLPATRVLFNKNKVTIDDVNKQWNTHKHTIQVAHHEGDPKKVRYIFGSGHTEHKDGEIIRAHHDPTGAKLGSFHVHNTIHVENGKIVKSAKPVDHSQKAPVLVYK